MAEQSPPDPLRGPQSGRRALKQALDDSELALHLMWRTGAAPPKMQRFIDTWATTTLKALKIRERGLFFSQHLSAVELKWWSSFPADGRARCRSTPSVAVIGRHLSRPRHSSVFQLGRALGERTTSSDLVLPREHGGLDSNFWMAAKQGSATVQYLLDSMPRRFPCCLWQLPHLPPYSTGVLPRVACKKEDRSSRGLRRCRCQQDRVGNQVFLTAGGHSHAP